jgi:hypothetical protein
MHAKNHSVLTFLGKSTAKQFSMFNRRKPTAKHLTRDVVEFLAGRIKV